MIKKGFQLLILMGCIVNALAQQTATYTNELSTYNKALELFENNQFLAAQSLFKKIKKDSDNQTIKGDCAFYIASSAIRLNQQGADKLMEDFVEDYPISLKRNSAYIDVANYYFDTGKYSFSRKWYDKVDERSLSRSELETFNFNNGYAYFQNKRYSEANKYFNRVRASETYGAQAKYYLGFIAYEGDDYQEANALFDSVKENDEFAEDLSYYQADMNFKLGKFQEAIDEGLKQFDNANPKEKSELSKIIGESYFNQEKYAQAIPYLQGYKGKAGKWNNTDYYQLGYAYYKQGDYTKAINEFNKIIDGRNAVAQNAYYHLAESYLKSNQKQQALNAFKNASEMDFSLQIQEDAFLNYAKLSYEIGNPYQSVPEVLSAFISTYPKNANNDALNDLLIDSYISSKNYKAALAVLEGNKSFENKVAFQKVAFYRALELYNNSDYKASKAMLKRSLKEPREPKVTARAIYWLAENEFQLSNFEEALIGYKQFLQMPQANNTPEFDNSYYNLGYNQFKLKQYSDAISSFSTYVNSATIETTREKDAYLRLGDSYFVTSDYWKAMENYNKAIELNTPDKDYASFQKAISYGFVNKPDTKIMELEAFTKSFPKSFYRDDALYELGNTYIAQDQIEKGFAAYDKLVATIPGSSYVPKAMVKKALLLDNDAKANEALALFKQVAAQFPSTPESLQAVSAAKLIYIDQGRVDEYANWVNTLDFVSVEDNELDDAAYQAAEQPYLENRASLAINRFKDYLNKFPNGKHALQAHFYLGQLYYAENDLAQATPYFEYVVAKERNEFTEQALARVSEIYLTNKAYAKAITALSRLETEADFPQNIMFAQTNIMKAAYELEQYEKAVTYAEKVLANSKVETAIKSDAQIIIARAAIKTGNEEKAQLAYAEVTKIATGALAAEALFYDAYFKNKAQQFEASNTLVQRLAKDYSGYKYYGAKGLVLMAKNFYGLKDAYQATFILERVISNFGEYGDVVAEAQKELTAIKTNEAKTNASVETQGN